MLGNTWLSNYSTNSFLLEFRKGGSYGLYDLSHSATAIHREGGPGSTQVHTAQEAKPLDSSQLMTLALFHFSKLAHAHPERPACHLPCCLEAYLSPYRPSKSPQPVCTVRLYITQGIKSDRPIPGPVLPYWSYSPKLILTFWLDLTSLFLRNRDTLISHVVTL